jgi:hypothetical protein
MQRDTVGKLTRAAILSLLALATTSGVAAWEVMAAGPAVVLPAGQGGGGLAQRPGLAQADPTPTSTPDPLPLPVPLPSPLPVP